MVDNELIGTKRLLLCVGRDLHAEVKSRAALRNVTIQKYLLQALLEKMAVEDRYNQG
jgi:hypothetical protein